MLYNFCVSFCSQGGFPKLHPFQKKLLLQYHFYQITTSPTYPPIAQSKNKKYPIFAENTINLRMFLVNCHILVKKFKFRVMFIIICRIFNHLREPLIFRNFVW